MGWEREDLNLSSKNLDTSTARAFLVAFNKSASTKLSALKSIPFHFQLANPFSVILLTAAVAMAWVAWTTEHGHRYHRGFLAFSTKPERSKNSSVQAFICNLHIASVYVSRITIARMRIVSRRLFLFVSSDINLPLFDSWGRVHILLPYYR